jgi:hypothetical protein
MMKVPLADHPAPVFFYIFSQARIFTGMPKDTEASSWTATMIGDPKEAEELSRKYPDFDGRYRINAKPHEFARLLAKIAYSYVVAEYGLDGFTPFVIDLILGKSDEYFLYVGGSLDIPQPVPNGGHHFSISILGCPKKRGWLIVEVRLFSGSTGLPKYHVVVGEISYENPRHVAMFTKHALDGKIINTPFAVT